MAADVSSLVRILGSYKDDQNRTVVNESSSDKSTSLITMDLLGGSFSKLVNDSQELDLDLQVPSGWEKRLDLKSGKVYLQRCNALNPTSISEHKQSNPTLFPKLQDLNFPPSQTRKTPLNLFDETSLQLKLVSSTSPSSYQSVCTLDKVKSALELKLVSSTSPSSYQSVCTLDKVKSALERAEKDPIKKRSSSLWKSSMSSSPSYSSSSSSIKDVQEEENEEKVVICPVAAGCPSCLSYVLIMKNNPECPRCKSAIELPLKKKPRIDLNMTI